MTANTNTTTCTTSKIEGNGWTMMTKDAWMKMKMDSINSVRACQTKRTYLKSRKMFDKTTKAEFAQLAREFTRLFTEVIDDIRNIYRPYQKAPVTGLINQAELVCLLPEDPAINPLMLPQAINVLNDRVMKLLPSLKGIAYKFSFYGLDPQDTLQSIVEGLLEKASTDPEFASQQDAYIRQYAKFTAWHLIQSTNTYNDYVDSEDWTTDDEGDEMSAFEFVPCDDPEPEASAEFYEAETMLAEVVSQLAPENRLIVKMLYVGYSRSEIADKLNISRPAITQRINTIRKALRPVCKEFGLAAYAA